MEWIFEPWPWYVSGPLIALIMFFLIFSGKKFGMSSNLRTLCTISGVGKDIEYFQFDWKSKRWNLVVLFGAMIGGFIGAHWLSPGNSVDISSETVSSLQSLGFSSPGETYLPQELFGMEALSNLKSMVILLSGGILVGFGARYAGGCTSGHAISGLSDLQVPSLISVIGFFIGGLIMVHLLFPLIFG